MCCTPTVCGKPFLRIARNRLSALFLVMIVSFILFGCGSATAAPPMPAPAPAPAPAPPVSTTTTSSAVTVSQDLSQSTVTLRWDNPSNLTLFQVQVDDTPAFHKPLVWVNTSTPSLKLYNFDAGFAPGTLYYVRIEPTGQTGTFRLSEQTWGTSYVTYAFARNSWNFNRIRMGQISGMNWNDSAQTWSLASSWGDAPNKVATDAYQLEIYFRSAINMAVTHQDNALLNELSQFLVAYEPRFTTLGALRGLQSSGYNTSALTGEGSDSVKTLSYIIPGSPSTVRTCYLCTSQFLYPVARLMRVIATLPASQRTSSMKSMIQFYEPLIIYDHLMNLLYDAPNERLATEWSLLAQNDPYVDHTMGDTDLWVIAAAAEILGASADDPSLVYLPSNIQSELVAAVNSGVKLLQMKRTMHPNTTNFNGAVVGSADYFENEDSSSEVAFSAYTGSSFPSSVDKSMQPNLSWDSSHASRLPILFRALYDNKKATGTGFSPSGAGNGFPTGHDIQMIINQYLYRVFQGDSAKPLFNNYFDGSNGWYRVGYSGSNFGYPPVQDCNANSNVGSFQEPCLISGDIQGWGAIAFFDAYLSRLEYSVINLAWTEDSSISAFRDRYYGSSYRGEMDNGSPYYQSNVLFWVMGQVAERLR
jgi:hypothetical protein